MDKLNLNLNDLEVNSFQTNPEQEDEQGTVQGHGCFTEFDCEPSYEQPCASQPWCAPTNDQDCLSEEICVA